MRNYNNVAQMRHFRGESCGFKTCYCFLSTVSAAAPDHK